MTDLSDKRCKKSLATIDTNTKTVYKKCNNFIELQIAIKTCNIDDLKELLCTSKGGLSLQQV